MAISYVGKGAYVNSTSSLTVPYPAGIQVGDLLLVHFEYDYGSDAITAPTGFTQVGSTLRVHSFPYAWYGVYYKIAQASDLSSGAYFGVYGQSERGIAVAFRGVNHAHPINGVTTSPEQPGTTYTLVNPAASVANCMLVNGLGVFNNGRTSLDNFTAWSNASLSSFTEGHDQSDTAEDGGGIAFYYGVKPTAGAVSNTIITSESINTRVVGVNILLEPYIPPAKFVNIGGVWRGATKVSVNIGGVWKEATVTKVNVGGVWRNVT